jgi:hypothetical protein
MFEYQNRHVGVKIPDGQLREGEKGPAKTVSHAVKCEFVATQFFDDYGTPHREVLIKVGNAWYKAPNSEQWAAALKPLLPWLSAGIEEKLVLAEATAPSEDTVDIVGSVAKQIIDKTEENRKQL